MEKNIALFIDTNLAQTFIGDSVFLSQVGVRSGYYLLVQFIRDNRLEDKVEICIPEVVVREMKKHMIKCFEKRLKALRDDIDSHKKIFGDLLQINYEVQMQSEKYNEYVESLFSEFFRNERNLCKPVSYPKEGELVDTLLDKAINAVKPFNAANGSGKKYTDAGFKDALIAETIYSYCAQGDRIGVLISSDRDYGERFSKKINDRSKFVILSSYEDAIEALKQYYKVDPIQRIRGEFEGNSYWHERVLSEVGIELDESVTERIVEDVVSCEDETYIVRMKFVVNETEYLFTIHFDLIANDIIDMHYDIQND